MNPDICELCGLDLNTLGMYRGYVHYRADTEDRRVPCIELSEAEERHVEEMAKYMTLRMTEVLECLTRTR